MVFWHQNNLSIWVAGKYLKKNVNLLGHQLQIASIINMFCRQQKILHLMLQLSVSLSTSETTYSVASCKTVEATSASTRFHPNRLYEPISAMEYISAEEGQNFIRPKRSTHALTPVTIGLHIWHEARNRSLTVSRACKISNFVDLCLFLVCQLDCRIPLVTMQTERRWLVFFWYGTFWLRVSWATRSGMLSRKIQQSFTADLLW